MNHPAEATAVVGPFPPPVLESPKAGTAITCRVAALAERLRQAAQ